MQLTKGLEVEIYTGKKTGEVIGLSDRIVRDLSGFVREPDSRNVEYTTPPLNSYDRLLCAILQPRRQLRHYLSQLGPDYTLIPGSCLALGGTDTFYRSDPQNPYHSYIEQTYGTQVVTASIHINIGIPDVEELMRACRLVRLEAPLYLALSASSPFLNGEATGYHSSRWQMFPKTPKEVPLFSSHSHFVQWTEAQLALGTMQNVRHLWSAVRPNGDNRPHNLNRLELRICDLVTNPLSLLAIVALLEARLQQMLADPSLDPLQQSQLTPVELLDLADRNEIDAAVGGLDSTLYHWQDGRAIAAREWIEELYRSVQPQAKYQGFACFLPPLLKILREGSVAQQWLGQYQGGKSPQTIIQEAIEQMETEEAILAEDLCLPPSKVQDPRLSFV
ncbi:MULTISPECIES: glutamate--cysteine ligase [unclassified Synechocystis]|uniref:glutamate--cysteine ligase n=1 Tax=unclassified Synechocystis TaxID=2640012 RepID=UPI0004029B2F|nr:MULTISPECIES: glutamate--cysteine ligase [unclassified Synechocystis]AIE75509.1 glutamate--cysteine ligase, putative [Synechocystis sp. PCC 6714]MCT0253723.1 glutamate--cysteine ligase [Synechocystis sp. CS-94]